ncbi:hypothetical protein [Macrococcoides caseolyticum]|nr:hypothetical protein [Macrococcus caseolyticus]MCE4956733.1 hypothetical protein [Macrococcus caseolyticus]
MNELNEKNNDVLDAIEKLVKLNEDNTLKIEETLSEVKKLNKVLTTIK